MTALVARLRLGPQPSARVPRIVAGSRVRFIVDFLDVLSSALTATTGIRFDFASPDGSRTEMSGGDIATLAPGTYAVDRELDAPGIWRVAVDGVGTIRIDQAALKVDPLEPSDEASLPWVDDTSGEVAFPDGTVVRVLSIQRMPSLGAPQDGDTLPVVRAGAGGRLAWSALRSAAEVAAAEEIAADLGQPFGYAPLGGGAQVPLANLPATTPDGLLSAAQLADADLVPLGQAGDLVRATLLDVAAYILGRAVVSLRGVVTLAPPVTLGATRNRAVVQISEAGTVTLDSAVGDGWECDVAHAGASGLVALVASGSGVIAAGGALPSLLPGRAARIVKVTRGGVATFQLLGGAPAPQMGLDRIAGALTSGAVSIAGSFLNTTISAVEYQIDGAGAWVTPSATIASGRFDFSFSASGLSAGTRSIVVRDKGNPSVFAANTFAVAAAAEVTVATPASVLQGASVAISGSYIGTPAGLQYDFDGLNNWQTLVASPAGGFFSALVPAPGVGSHTVRVRFAAGSPVSAPSGSFAVIGVPALSVTTPTGVLALGTLAVSGTYSYSDPVALDYRVRSQDVSAAGRAIVIDWTPAAGITFTPGGLAGGGDWSGLSIAGLPTGAYLIEARIRELPLAQAISGWTNVGIAIRCDVSTFTPVAGGTVNLANGVVAGGTTGSIRWQFANQKSGTATNNFLGNTGGGGTTFSGALPVPARPGTYDMLILNVAATAYQQITLTTTAPSSPVISVIPVNYSTNRSRSSPVTVTGYYGGGTPANLRYRWSGELVWREDAALTVDGDGFFTLVIPAPTYLSAGSGRILEVQWADASSNIAQYNSLTFV